MDNTKPPGWQPNTGMPAPQLGFDNTTQESHPLAPPPYAGQANLPPYQDSGPYPGPYPPQPGYQNPYPQPPGNAWPGQPGSNHQQPGYPQQQPGYPQQQPGYPQQQPGYPQQQPGYPQQQPTYPQQQPGYPQQPYPGQPGYQNPYPTQPDGYQNAYPENQPVYQSEFEQSNPGDERQYIKEKKKNKKFFYIIGGVVVLIAVICIGVSISKSSEPEKKEEPKKTLKIKSKTTKPPTQDKFVTENCTLVMNLFKFLNCTDLKNCQPTVLLNLPQSTNETVGNSTAAPALTTVKPTALADGNIMIDPSTNETIILDPFADFDFTDSTSQNDTADVIVNDEKNATIDVSHFLNCSMVIFCNGSLSCGDNMNLTILSTSKTGKDSDVTRTIVYRRPSLFSAMPLFIPLPIPIGGLGGNKFGKKKYNPSFPIGGNPLKPKIFGGKRKG